MYVFSIPVGGEWHNSSIDFHLNHKNTSSVTKQVNLQSINPNQIKLCINLRNGIGYYKNLAIIICYHRGDIFIPFCCESRLCFCPKQNLNSDVELEIYVCTLYSLSFDQ